MHIRHPFLSSVQSIHLGLPVCDGFVDHPQTARRDSRGGFSYFLSKNCSNSCDLTLPPPFQIHDAAGTASRDEYIHLNCRLPPAVVSACIPGRSGQTAAKDATHLGGFGTFVWSGQHTRAIVKLFASTDGPAACKYRPRLTKMHEFGQSEVIATSPLRSPLQLLGFQPVLQRK